MDKTNTNYESKLTEYVLSLGYMPVPSTDKSSVSFVKHSKKNPGVVCVYDKMTKPAFVVAVKQLFPSELGEKVNPNFDEIVNQIFDTQPDDKKRIIAAHTILLEEVILPVKEASFAEGLSVAIGTVKQKLVQAEAGVASQKK